MIDYNMSFREYQRKKKLAINLLWGTNDCTNTVCKFCPIIKGTPYATCYALERLEPLLAIKRVSDLVEQQSVDWSQVKIDTKIYVRNSVYEEWVPRYFKECKNGHICVFRSGKTSFTAKNEIIYYKYGKLAE